MPVSSAQNGDIDGPAPPSRRARLGEQKRQRILDAALEMFSRHGLHGARLDQVAERADVSKTNLLYYYATKDVLYLAVLTRMLDRWLEPLDSFTPDSDPEQAITAYVTRKLTFSRDEPAASRLFCMEMLQGAPLLRQVLTGPLKRQVDRTALVIRHWVREGRLADIDPRHLLFAIWAITQHYADFAAQIDALTGHTLTDPAFAAGTARNVMAIILRGALPRLPPGLLLPGAAKTGKQSDQMV
jgi:TetR/AcrR family transcriptional regulator